MRKASLFNVTSVTPTSTGVSVRFNGSLDPTGLNLYDQGGQFGRAIDARGCQLDAGDIRAVPISKIARRPAKAGTEIRNPRTSADARRRRQRVIGREAAIVVLVMGKQLLRRHAVKVAARGAQFGKNDRG